MFAAQFQLDYKKPAFIQFLVEFNHFSSIFNASYLNF